MANIVYKFVASDADSVKKAFDDIGNAAKRSARQTEQSAKRGSRSQRKAVGDQERAARRLADTEARQQHKVHRIARRNQLRRARANRRAREREARETKRALNKKAQMERRAQDRMARDRRRQQIAQMRAEDRLRNQRRSRRMAIGRGVVGMGARVVGGAALATGAVAGQAVREAMSLQSQVAKLAVQMRGAGQQLRDPTRLRQQMQDAAAATPGMKAADIAGGVSQFVTATGEGKLGVQMAETFATVAQAADADIRDIASAAAQLFDKFDVKSVDQMSEALAKWVFQGKKGAFELNDMASQANRLAAAAKRWGGMNNARGAAVMGGLAQMARGSTGSPEMAATAIENMFTQLTTKSKQIKKEYGVNVYDSQGRAKDITKLLPSLISAVERKSGKAGLPAAMAKLFGARGIKAVSPLQTAFMEAGGGAKGAAAMEAVLKDAIEATGDYSEVQRDAATMQTMAGAKLTASWEKIKSTLGDRLVPVVEDVVTGLSKVMDDEGLWTDVSLAIEVLGENAKFAAEVLGMFKRKGPRDPYKEIQKANKEEERARRSGERWVKRARAGDQSPAVLAGLERRSAAINAAVAKRRSAEKLIQTQQKQDASELTLDSKEALIEKLFKSNVASGDFATESAARSHAQLVADKATESPLAMRTDMRGIDLPLIGNVPLTAAGNLSEDQKRSVSNYMDNMAFSQASAQFDGGGEGAAGAKGAAGAGLEESANRGGAQLEASARKAGAMLEAAASRAGGPSIAP